MYTLYAFSYEQSIRNGGTTFVVSMVYAVQINVKCTSERAFALPTILVLLILEGRCLARNVIQGFYNFPAY